MPNEKKQLNKIQDIHRRKYLASIHLLPEEHQKKIKEYFQVIFTFLALIFAVVFAIEPTLTTISELDRQLIDARQVSTDLQTKISRLSQLNLQYDTLQPQLLNIFSAIPQTENSQMLLAQLQSIAAEQHLSITTLTAQADTKQTNPLAQDITFTVNAEGAYPDIRTFLQDGIQFQRIILPTSITISNAIGSNNLSLIINGKAYFTP